MIIHCELRDNCSDYYSGDGAKWKNKQTDITDKRRCRLNLTFTFLHFYAISLWEKILRT